MFNNGTMHYNITLPTELNESCKIKDYNKFVKDHNWSNSHMAIAAIFLINIFWCPVLEPNLALSLATVAYHLFLIKKQNYFNLIGYTIGIFVYLFKVQHIMHEHDKTFLSWIKLIGCLLIIAYYIYNLKKLNEKKKNH